MRLTYGLFILAIMGLWGLNACSSGVISMQTGIDTPQNHLYNGQSLLRSGKVGAAHREFLRAKEQLDANYAPLHVGLGLVYGHLGDFERAHEAMRIAEQFAHTPEQKQEVERGRQALEELARTQDN